MPELQTCERYLSHLDSRWPFHSVGFGVDPDSRADIFPKKSAGKLFTSAGLDSGPTFK